MCLLLGVVTGFFDRCIAPWSSSFTVVDPTSQSGKKKLQNYRIKNVSRKPVAIATYCSSVNESVMDLFVLE